MSFDGCLLHHARSSRKDPALRRSFGFVEVFFYGRYARSISVARLDPERNFNKVLVAATITGLRLRTSAILPATDDPGLIPAAAAQSS